MRALLSIAVNLALVFIASLVLSDRQAFQLGTGCFFAFLTTLPLWLYDDFKPICDERFDGSPFRVASLSAFARDVRRYEATC